MSATEEIAVRIRLKHVWLIRLVNYPLAILGLDPYLPKCCFSVETI